MDLPDPGTVTACLATIRQQPFLRLDDRVVILDLQFLADLLTTGIYWLTFDSLDAQHRDSFRDLWGRAFELMLRVSLVHSIRSHPRFFQSISRIKMGRLTPFWTSGRACSFLRSNRRF